MGKLCDIEAKEGNEVSTAAFNREGVKDRGPGEGGLGQKEHQSVPPSFSR